MRTTALLLLALTLAACHLFVQFDADDSHCTDGDGDGDSDGDSDGDADGDADGDGDADCRIDSPGLALRGLFEDSTCCAIGSGDARPLIVTSTKTINLGDCDREISNLPLCSMCKITTPDDVLCGVVVSELAVIKGVTLSIESKRGVVLLSEGRIEVEKAATINASALGDLPGPGGFVGGPPRETVGGEGTGRDGIGGGLGGGSNPEVNPALFGGGGGGGSHANGGSGGTYVGGNGGQAVSDCTEIAHRTGGCGGGGGARNAEASCGGSEGHGGHGGGWLALVSMTKVLVEGTIAAIGTPGTQGCLGLLDDAVGGGGGGGAGGTIVLSAPALEVTGTLDVSGGRGGEGRAQGAAGTVEHAEGGLGGGDPDIPGDNDVLAGVPGYLDSEDTSPFTVGGGGGGAAGRVYLWACDGGVDLAGQNVIPEPASCFGLESR